MECIGSAGGTLDKNNKKKTFGDLIFWDIWHWKTKKKYNYSNEPKLRNNSTQVHSAVTFYEITTF